MPRPKLELADIFREYGEQYRSSYPLPLHHLKAMSAIQNCRTAALGGHVDECLECGYQRISYNSCRNRCCPKCQYSAKERWVKAREDELLPVPYFHLVFTIPAEINLLVPYNQKLLYNLLFKATSQTISTLVADPKYLGAQYGMIAVLHTWGQNLQLHPHLHCIIPGGGLAKDGTQWKGVKSPKFFLPVRVLSSLFRGKFLHLFKESKEDLNFGGKGLAYANSSDFKKLLNKLYKKKWVVYAKPPFGGPRQVVRYLGRYTHRIAITNRRILSIKDERVSFLWKDYADGAKKKVMTLQAMEFIRRFLQHVPPPGFHRIRHYGFLSTCNRQSKLQTCIKLLGPSGQQSQLPPRTAQADDFVLHDPNVCPDCGSKAMVLALNTLIVIAPRPPPLELEVSQLIHIPHQDRNEHYQQCIKFL